MADLSVKLPKLLEGDKAKLEKQIDELVMSEAKRKALLKFIDEAMKGAQQLSDKELVKLGRKLKKGRFKKLKKQRLGYI